MKIFLAKDNCVLGILNFPDAVSTRMESDEAIDVIDSTRYLVLLDSAGQEIARFDQCGLFGFSQPNARVEKVELR